MGTHCLLALLCTVWLVSAYLRLFYLPSLFLSRLLLVAAVSLGYGSSVTSGVYFAFGLPAFWALWVGEIWVLRTGNGLVIFSSTLR